MPETAQKLSIIVCGNYGASNLGDEAILAGLLSLIRPFADDITVMSARPEQTAKFHNINSVWLFPCGLRSLVRCIFTGGLIKTLLALRKADVFVLGGGGLFSDEKPLAVVIWFAQALLAKLFRKPIVCLGQSVGPLRSFWSRFLTKKVFQWTKDITVRDEYSKKILEQLRIKHVVVLSDPAFLLSDSKWTVKTSKKEKYIVISLRPWSTVLQKKNIKIIAKFIDWITVKYGFTVFLLPFQDLKDNDTTVCQTLKIHLKNKKNVQLLPFHEDFYKTIDTISKAEAVIGMRLHSIIFSAMTHTPFLTLSYSQKVRSIAQDLDQERFILEWNDLKLNDLKQKFITLMNLRLSVSRILAKKTLFMQKKAGRHAELAQRFFSS